MHVDDVGFQQDSFRCPLCFQSVCVNGVIDVRVPFFFQAFVRAQRTSSFVWFRDCSFVFLVFEDVSLCYRAEMRPPK